VTDLPSVADVVDAFRAAPEAATAPPRGEDVLGLLHALHRNNLEQWRQEDATRDPGAGDAAVAEAKRAIDALNGTRHRLVEAVDVAFAGAIEQNPAATPTTETPAMVFDRLSVLTIRIHFTEGAGDGFAARLPALELQVALLQEALEGLFDDVRAGRKRFVPYESLKLYGSGEQSTDR
jgi:hypothetical protein